MPTKRVIIADDALDFGRMLQASLATLDRKLKITLVPSAEEALLETRRGATDLLISDVRLPGMSGFELVRKARVHYPALKIIVVTGMKDESMRQQAEAAGADAFFHKPLSIADFLDKAQELLGMPVTPGRDAPAESSPPQINGDIAPLLASLRGRLGAKGVVLTNPSGDILFAAAESSPLPAAGLASIAGALAAVEQVASRLGRTGGILTFHGQDGEIAAAAVQNMALVALLTPGSSQLRLALAVEEVLAVQKELGAMLSAPAASAPALSVSEAAVSPEPHPEVVPAAAVHAPSAPAPEPASPLVDITPTALDAVEEDLGSMEGLFERKAAPIAAQDVDSFWEQAVSSTAAASVPAANALSFEDALRLGLTGLEEEN